MTVVDCVQRSPEWVQARLGRLCGSKANAMLSAGTKGAESTGRRNLRLQLVLERLTGRSHERDYMSHAMRDGIEREDAARDLYECVAGRLIQPVGYVMHDELMAGYSPDGMIGDDFEGIVEAKSPEPAAHLEYLRTGQIPKTYGDQIVHGLWITGARWCDWFSYQPAFDERLQIKLVRVYRDEAIIAAHDRAVRAFLREVDLEMVALRTLADTFGVLQQVAS